MAPSIRSAVGAALTCVALAGSTGATEPQPNRPGQTRSTADPDDRSSEGSGYQLSLGAAYLLPTATAAILWSARPEMSARATLAASSTMVLAAPAVHLSYGRARSAGDALLGQFAGGTFGALLGWSIGSFACSSDDRACDEIATRGLVLGALAGQVSFGMLDVFGSDHIVSGAEEMVTPFVSPLVGQSAAARSPWQLDWLGFELGIEARL